MKIEDQVVSLELSKKLKELGVKQESYFYWVKKVFANDPPVDPWIILDCMDTHALENVSAFTSSELGEVLPKVIGDKYLCIRNKFGLWEIAYRREKVIYMQKEKTEAGARAKMLIYLIENKLWKCLNDL